MRVDRVGRPSVHGAQRCLQAHEPVECPLIFRANSPEYLFPTLISCGMSFDSSSIKVDEARNEVAAAMNSEARPSSKFTGKETYNPRRRIGHGLLDNDKSPLL